jgi:hypothetical protein
MLGLTWIAWLGLAANFTAAFVNAYWALRWRRHFRSRAVTYAKLVGFAAATACAPPGFVPDEVRSLARAALPDDLRDEFLAMLPVTSTTRVQ